MLSKFKTSLRNPRLDCRSSRNASYKKLVNNINCRMSYWNSRNYYEQTLNKTEFKKVLGELNL